MASIPVFAPMGALIRPFVPSSLYASLLRGDAHLAKIRVISYDASMDKGWSEALQTSEDSTMHIYSHTYPPGTDSSVQVHNEAAAGLNAILAVELLVDLSDSIIILRNDCSGALTALEKGSTTSPILQEYAMAMARVCARLNATCLFMHVPGTTLVAEGTDAASRGGADHERGPACGPELRLRVHNLAARHGWKISLDLFASSANTLVPRFFSRHPEIAAECIDALSVPDWNASRCPECGKLHREVVFAFPPIEMLPHFMAKARQDEVRGIIITPTSVTGAHWNRLLQAALPSDGKPYIAVTHPMNLLRHSAAFFTAELAIFAVDFRISGVDTRPMRRPCLASYSHRPRAGPAQIPADPALSAVRLALELALRPKPFE